MKKPKNKLKVIYKKAIPENQSNKIQLEEVKNDLEQLLLLLKDEVEEEE